MMKPVLIALAAVMIANAPAPAQSNATKPTIVLVHGAFAESASWNSVVSRLLAKGYKVVALANPLRSVAGDAAYTASSVRSIAGPVVLVGHSYGGEVISVAAASAPNVRALVFVSGLAPDQGESASGLLAQFPGSTLGPTLAPPVTLADGGKDLYIDQVKFHAQFAADVSERESALMGATQRPIVAAAFDEPASAAAWKALPSWFIWGTLDKNIPPAAHEFMAKRAHAREAIAVKGSSHVVMISHPAEVAAMIEEAAAAR
jgi:pimeloyl-ACP methyl ester carboxylesterase